MSPRKRTRTQIARMGGKARKAKLSAKRRSAIARKAAKARWGRHAMNTEAPDPYNGIAYVYVGPPVTVRPA